MIRKLQRWWLSNQGPAVQMEYNPAINKWRVRCRYNSFGTWLDCWHPRTGCTQFDNINDAQETMDRHREKLHIDDGGKWDRIISFVSPKIKW
jgi:hypothetical protein